MVGSTQYNTKDKAIMRVNDIVVSVVDLTDEIIFGSSQIDHAPQIVIKEGVAGVVTAVARNNQFKVLFNNGQEWWFDDRELIKHV